MMAGGEYLFQSAVPMCVRTGPLVTAGSHFGAASADPSNLTGRRWDSVTVEVFYTPSGSSSGRRVRCSRVPCLTVRPAPPLP